MGGSYYSFPCSILSTGKDHKTPQQYPYVLTTSKRISLRSIDSFQGLTPKSPSSWHRPLAPSLNFYDHVTPATRQTIDQLAGAHLAPKQPTQVNKITSSCEICSGPHDTQYCMENLEQAFVEYASSHTDVAGGLVSDFMASQDARLSKFEADFKQQQSEMSNKINNVLKSITDRITGALPSDIVKNPKLNVNSTSPVWSARSYPTLQPVMEIRTQQPKEPHQTLEDKFKDLHINLPVLEVLAHAPMYNAILDKYVESIELGKNGSIFIHGEMPKKIEDPELFTLPYETKSYPIGIVRDVEVHIRRLKLLTNFYVIDMKKDPETPLLVGRGFPATTNAVMDYRKAKIAVGEGITSSDGVGARTPYYARKDFLDYHLPGEWEIARDAKINPFKDVLVFRRIVEFLWVIPINLKRNMWESEDLIKNLINWDKPPKMEMGHGMPRLG
ncbi:hypothetical protein Tco_1212666 [Tanacetum coccineum]